MRKYFSRNNTKNDKLFVSDVDGVMTDAGMYYSQSRDFKKIQFSHDGMGFQF